MTKLVDVLHFVLIVDLRQEVVRGLVEPQILRQLFVFYECAAVVHLGPGESQTGFIILKSTLIGAVPRSILFDQLAHFFPSYIGTSFPTRVLELFHAYQACLVFVFGGQVPVDLLPFVAQLLGDDRHGLPLVSFLEAAHTSRSGRRFKVLQFAGRVEFAHRLGTDLSRTCLILDVAILP